MGKNSGVAWKPILLGGFIAGLLDFAYAYFTLWPRGPVRGLQSIASGLLGASAFNGGFGAAALGALCHFIIAFGAAAVYYLVSRKFPVLVRQSVICGLLYGIVVYLVMNFVVLPLSAVPFKLSYPVAALAKGFVSHAFLVGLPISLATRWYSKSKT
jgi:hypothetical protein